MAWGITGSFHSSQAPDSCWHYALVQSLLSLASFANFTMVLLRA